LEKVQARGGCESCMSSDELVASIAEIAQAGADIQYERHQALGNIATQTSSSDELQKSEEK